MKVLFLAFLQWWEKYLDPYISTRGGCSSVGRAGLLVIRRSLVRILAPRGRTELYAYTPKLLLMCSWHLVEAATAISKGPAMSWRLIQVVPWPTPIE